MPDPKPPTCRFSLAWIGPCGSVYVGPTGMCEKHAATLCVSCKAPATGECCHTGQFVCGHPLCDDCGSAQTPQGYHTHARKPGRGRGALNFIFSGETPSLVFVEVEGKDGKSVRVGRWFTENGRHVLAIDSLTPDEAP